MPGEVFLGPQGAHSGSRMSSAAVEAEVMLRLGLSGSSIAVSLELCSFNGSCSGCDASRKDAHSAREEELAVACVRRESRESRGSKTNRQKGYKVERV